MGHYAAGQTANKTMWPAKLTNEVFLHLALLSSPKTGDSCDSGDAACLQRSTGRFVVFLRFRGHLDMG
jgi:hypothetical protein